MLRARVYTQLVGSYALESITYIDCRQSQHSAVVSSKEVVNPTLVLSPHGFRFPMKFGGGGAGGVCYISVRDILD